MKDYRPDTTYCHAKPMTATQEIADLRAERDALREERDRYREALETIRLRCRTASKSLTRLQTLEWTGGKTLTPFEEIGLIAGQTLDLHRAAKAIRETKEIKP